MVPYMLYSGNFIACDWEKKEGLVVVASLFDIKKIAGEGWDREGQEALRQQI